MALTADILNTQPLAKVRLTASGLTAGVSYEIHGSADGRTWLAAKGTAKGSDVVVSDPLAPLGEPVTYRLVSGSTESVSGPVTRSYEGWDVITDLSGKNVVDALRDDNGGDSRSYAPREYVAEVPGRAIGPARYSRTAGAPTGSVTVRTTGTNSSVLDELIMANRPVVVLHNPCPLPDCDLDPAMQVFITGVSNNVGPRKDVAERIWVLSYRYADTLTPNREAPIATFDDVKAAYTTFDALEADNLTFDAVKGGDFLAE